MENHVFYACGSISVLDISSFVSFFLDSTYKQNYIFVLLCLAYFTSIIISRSIHSISFSLATNSILHRARTNNFTICMEKHKTSNSQSDLEKEEWNWRNQPTWLQALLQSHSYQDIMVLAQRQKYRSMEQNRKPRDKSTHIWTPYLWQRRQEYTMD